MTAAAVTLWIIFGASLDGTAPAVLAVIGLAAMATTAVAAMKEINSN